MTTALTRRIQLRGAARAALSDRSPELLVAGPAGTGKTMKWPASILTRSRETS